MKKKQLPYEVSLAMVENGLVVKVGCQLIVAKKIKEVTDGLSNYYNGNVPEYIKKELGDIPAYRCLNGTVEECCGEPDKEHHNTVPSFLKKGQATFLLVQAINGIVVIQGERCRVYGLDQKISTIVNDFKKEPV